MTLDAAIALARTLTHLARRYAEEHPHATANTLGLAVTVDLDSKRIVFVSREGSSHSLDIANSTEERIWCHFQGFCGLAIVGIPKVGDRRVFHRGMYGLWSGTVEHVGTKRDGRAYFTVGFTKKNGHRGHLRMMVDEFSMLSLMQPIPYRA